MITIDGHDVGISSSTIDQKDGRETIIQILKMGPYDGMLTTQVAAALGIDQVTVRTLVHKHNLELMTIGNGIRKQLQSLEIMPKQKGQPPKFLPKKSIQLLVKIVNTPEAWAIYRQLWKIIESPTVYAEVQRQVHGTDFLSQMEKVISDQRRFNEEVRERLGSDGRARLEVIDVTPTRKQLNGSGNGIAD
jgi:hypothetical protein